MSIISGVYKIVNKHNGKVYIGSSKDVRIRGDKTNSFKVGISSDPRARLKAMQVGSPVKLLLTRAVEVQNPESVEKELHSAFAKYRIHGEWFSMPWKEAVDIFDSIVQHS